MPRPKGPRTRGARCHRSLRTALHLTPPDAIRVVKQGVQKYWTWSIYSRPLHARQGLAHPRNGTRASLGEPNSTRDAVRWNTARVQVIGSDELPASSTDREPGFPGRLNGTSANEVTEPSIGRSSSVVADDRKMPRGHSQYGLLRSVPTSSVPRASR